MLTTKPFYNRGITPLRHTLRPASDFPKITRRQEIQVIWLRRYGVFHIVVHNRKRTNARSGALHVGFDVEQFLGDCGRGEDFVEILHADGAVDVVRGVVLPAFGCGTWR